MVARGNRLPPRDCPADSASRIHCGVSITGEGTAWFRASDHVHGQRRACARNCYARHGNGEISRQDGRVRPKSSHSGRGQTARPSHIAGQTPRNLFRKEVRIVETADRQIRHVPEYRGTCTRGRGPESFGTSFPGGCREDCQSVEPGKKTTQQGAGGEAVTRAPHLRRWAA